MVPMKAFIVLAALAVGALGGVVRRDAPESGTHEHHHPPPFMEGLDDETKDKFKAIFHNHSMKDEAKDAALLNLATSVLTPERLAEFKEHQERFKQHRAQWKAEYDAKYAKLSPKAKKAADELKALWQNDSMDRAAKKAKKEEILKTLTDAERKAVEALHPHPHHPPPAFMRDLPQETQDKFRAIWHNNSLNGEAKQAALTKLAESTLTPQQLTEFKQHMVKMAEWKKKMEEKLAKLSPNARKAAHDIHAVWENDDLDWEEKKGKMEEIKAHLTDAEKAELKELHASLHSHQGKDDKSNSASKEQ